MIHPPHTDATDPAMPGPRRAHQLTLGTPVLIRLAGAPSQHPGGALKVILEGAIVEASRSFCSWEPFGQLLPFSRQTLRVAAVARRPVPACRAAEVAWVPLGSVQGQQYQQQAAGEKDQLGGPHAAFGDHFLQEHVVHVAQREQAKAQEKESLFFASVCEVVVPEGQHGEGGEHHHTQEEVPGGHMKEDGQQDQRGQEAHVDFLGSAKPRNSEAIRNRVHDSFTSLWPQGFARNPSLTPFIQILAITQTSSHVVLLPIAIYVLAAAQRLQLRFFGFLLHGLHSALRRGDLHLSP